MNVLYLEYARKWDWKIFIQRKNIKVRCYTLPEYWRRVFLHHWNPNYLMVRLSTLARSQKKRVGVTWTFLNIRIFRWRSNSCLAGKTSMILSIKKGYRYYMTFILNWHRLDIDIVDQMTSTWGDHVVTWALWLVVPSYWNPLTSFTLIYSLHTD